MAFFVWLTITLRSVHSMIITFRKIFVTVIFSLLLSAAGTFAQQSSSPFALPPGTLARDSGITLLATLFDGKITDEVRWVGLGEFTHGGEETALFKCGMVRYLILHRGFRQLLVEYPDVKLLPLNNYLQRSGSDDQDSVRGLARRILGRTVLACKPFFDLLVWIRNYNINHHNGMVCLRGIDVEGASTAFADYFMYNFLLPLDHSAAGKILSQWSEGPADSITVAGLNWAGKNRQRIVQYAGEHTAEELQYDISAARNALIHLALKRQNIYQASAFRDSIMAENVRSFRTAKSIIWAHNMHLTTADYALSLGNYLRAAVGKEYFCLLTDISGEARVWTISAKDNRLQKQEFVADKKSFASMIRRKYDLKEGVVFFDSLRAGSQPAFNNIDRSGWQTVIPGRGRPFDALAIFNRVEPFVFD